VPRDLFTLCHSVVGNQVMPVTKMHSMASSQMKKIDKVSPPFGWKAWLVLVDEDSECCRAQRRLLTTRRDGYIILLTKTKRLKIPKMMIAHAVK
jgi:hypothetical protein